MSALDNKLAVLSEAYKADIDDAGWLLFKSHSDVGLPLAHLIWEGIVEITPDTRESIESYINETYKLLMSLLEIPDESKDSFASFSELISYFEGK
jgi:hypothetical protein